MSINAGVWGTGTTSEHCCFAQASGGAWDSSNAPSRVKDYNQYEVLTYPSGVCDRYYAKGGSVMLWWGGIWEREIDENGSCSDVWDMDSEGHVRGFSWPVHYKFSEDEGE